MAAMIGRTASLVDVFTNEEYGLAHGENVIGRPSRTDLDKVPLRIHHAEANISRRQAAISVANHKKGVRVTVTTMSEAKNSTRIRSAERFGSKRGHIALKPGEAIVMHPGDIIEFGETKLNPCVLCASSSEYFYRSQLNVSTTMSAPCVSELVFVALLAESQTQERSYAWRLHIKGGVDDTETSAIDAASETNVRIWLG